MALKLTNLQDIAKSNIQTEEALQQIQNYTNANVAQVAGNVNTAPPAGTTPPPSAQAATPTPVVSPPVPKVVQPNNGSGGKFLPNQL